MNQYKDYYMCPVCNNIEYVSTFLFKNKQNNEYLYHLNNKL